MRNEGERAVAVGAALRWVGNPGTVAAVLVLAFNDRVGKRAWPGVVTGKLSDVAWMLVAPPVLALLLTPVLRLRGNRPAVVGIGGTAVAFALAKSGPVGGEVASWVWSLSGVPSRIKGDPTDLVVLPLLVLAWWLWRAGQRPWRGWQVLALIAVPGAVAAMVATSTVEHRPELWGEDGRPVLSADGHTWTSRDGGLTWTVLDRKRGAKARRDDGPTAAEGQCVRAEPLRCYRLLGMRGVEVSEDGRYSWSNAFTPPWSTPSPAPSTTPTGPVDPTRYEYPGELVVAALPDGGYAVIAHYAGHGLAVRTADGRWFTEGYPVLPPPPPAKPPERHSWTGLPVALAAGWSATLAGLAARLLVVASPDRGWRSAVVLMIRQGLGLYWVFLAGWLCGGRLLWSVSGWVVAGVISLWLLPMMTLLYRPERGSGLALPALGLAVGGAAMVPYVRWSAGELAAWSTASRHALYCAIVGTALGVLAGALPWRRTAGPRH
ncbi:hypothetical protein ACGFX4_11835 [Kitasatospora sp. NPDC048365]|uniref:hypothetical protein n=1 Tax=Kitasatospora sp. NPDC048365 TaxID=3364050 RepID=UPI003713F305